MDGTNALDPLKHTPTTPRSYLNDFLLLLIGMGMEIGVKICLDRRGRPKNSDIVDYGYSYLLSSDSTHSNQSSTSVDHQ